MEGLRFAGLLMLIALLLNFSLASASAANNEDVKITTASPLSGDNHATFTAPDYKILGKKIQLVENSASMVAANSTTFQVITQPLAPSTLATYGVPGATVPSWTPPPIIVSSSTLRTEVVKRAAVAIITTTIPSMATSAATDGVAGYTPPQSLDATPLKGERDITASTALPCVTTLATYGLPGESVVGWTPPVQSCPTTLVTATKSKAL